MSDVAIAELQRAVSDLRVEQASTKAFMEGGRDVVLDLKSSTEETLEKYGEEIGELKVNYAGMAADLHTVANRPTWAMVAMKHPRLALGAVLVVTLGWLLRGVAIDSLSVDALGTKFGINAAAAPVRHDVDSRIESDGTDPWQADDIEEDSVGE